LDHLERNLAILESRQPELAAILKTTAVSHIRIASARNGLPTAFFHRSASDSIPLHSRYDPLLEARRSLQESKIGDANYVVFLGCGLGYGLDALLETANRERIRVFVVESDPEILRAAFSVRDLTAILTLPHIHFAWPTAGNDLALQWKLFFDPVLAQESAFCTHPPSVLLNPGAYKSAAEIIKSKTLQIFTDINTLIGSSQAFLDNFVVNFPRAAALPGVKAFVGRFAGTPGILVSAGPSLDRNIQELRCLQSRALILATDTALKPLLAADIEPHFVLTADPRYENYLHLKDAVARESYLVAEATAYPDSLAAFEDRLIICTFAGSSLAALAGLLASKGYLNAWGSVATMCLDYALMLGCDPIVFVGQDLAYSYGRSYCAGLHWEKEWFPQMLGPRDWERTWAEIMALKKTIMTADMFGQPVATTDRLMSYWSWITAEIEKHPEVKFINATEGGILRDRVQIMSLREAGHRFCRQARDLRHEIRTMHAQAAQQESDLDLSALVRINEEVRQLQTIIERGLELCSPAHRHVPAQQLSARCEQVKHSVHSLAALSPILDCFNQMGNITFLRRLACQAAKTVPVQEIQDTYREYFQSIRQASQPIAEALSRLK
jgi:hypothetical protein